VKAIARRRAGYTHEVEIEGRHHLVIDEPPEAGGDDKGPSPLRAVAGALAACTAITCEMYAARKGWELGEISVEVETTVDQRATLIDCHVTLCVPEHLDAEQQRKLLVIAGKCPVHRALAGETPIEITDHINCIPASP
jgi:putative redox protein